MKQAMQFSDLAPYYDLLYREKLYKEEVSLIINTVKTIKSKLKKSVLDIGCGTGGHLKYFAQKGYMCTGLDSSENMLSIAQKKLQNTKQNFHKADARFFTLNKQFPLVVSLFHVFSYMNTYDDVHKFLDSVARHLTTDGVFVFDCWYGPGVLTQKPETKFKKISTKTNTVYRIKIPTLLDQNNIVEVKHELFLQNNITKAIVHFSELHTMRYFFFPEIQDLLAQHGLTIALWGHNNDSMIQQPTSQNWEVIFFCIKTSTGDR